MLYAEDSSNMQINSNGTITINAQDSNAIIAQFNIDLEVGDECAFSFEYNNGIQDSIFGAVLNVQETPNPISINENLQYAVYYDTSSNSTCCWIKVINANITFKYCRLNANNLIFKHYPEDYATALMRCLPYYRRVYMGYTAYALSDTFSMISAQSIVPMLNDSPTITVNVGNRTNVSAANYTYDESGAVKLTARASAAGAIRIYNEIVELSCEVL